MKRSSAIAIGSATVIGGGAAALALYSHLAGQAAEELVPPDGQFMEVDGARLHFVDKGSGPAIVMIHGLGAQLRNFSYGLLDRLTDDYRVILVDRPGSGYSTAWAPPQPGVAQQARMIAQLIDNLGLDKPLLVGHSLGGAVSLAMALNHPGIARGLVLLAPATQPQTEVPDAFRGMTLTAPWLRKLIANTVAAPLAKANAGRIRQQLFAPEPVPDDFEVRGGVALSLRPANIEMSMFELLSAGRELDAMAQRYPHLSLPVTIQFPRGDKVLDYRLHGERTAGAIPGATIDLIDGGHMYPLTQPEQAERVIRASFAAV